MRDQRHSHEHTHEEGVPTISRRDFKKLLLPPIGTKINLEKSFCEVLSHNTGKHRFSAWTAELPPLNYTFEWQEKGYKVEYLIPEKSRFSAVFLGFKQPEPTTPDMPELDQSDVAKVI
jgi:hypothetical protein